MPHKAHPAALSKAATYDENNGTVEWVLSTDGQDRDGEYIDVKGWEFEASSAPVLWAHRGNMGVGVNHTDVVGRVSDYSKDGDSLVGLVKFTRAHKTAREVEAMVADGTLVDGSVGFDPKEWKNADGSVTKRVPGSRAPRPAPGRRYTNQRLYEFSILPLPSNASASAKELIIKAMGSGDEFDIDAHFKALEDQAGRTRGHDPGGSQAER